MKAKTILWWILVGALAVFGVFSSMEKWRVINEQFPALSRWEKVLLYGR
jgi:hypothetical protein